MSLFVKFKFIELLTDLKRIVIAMFMNIGHIGCKVRMVLRIFKIFVGAIMTTDAAA